MTDKQASQNQPDFGKILVATAIGIALLAGITYAGYRFSQKNTPETAITLPAGATYLGPTPAGESQPTAPEIFTVDPDTPWLTHNGKVYPFSFNYPSTLTLVVYTDDPTDTVSIVWGNIPPQRNVLLNVERVEDVDPKYISLPKEEYVKNWWRRFSGLKGVKSVTPFTNAAGLKGYRARYYDYSDNAPIDNVFFEVPNDPSIIIHLANGILEQSVFDRIIHSVTWTSETPTPAAPTSALPTATQ